MNLFELDTLLGGHLLQAVAGVLYAILLGYYLVMWSKYGRDTRAGMITPQAEPPEEITPAAIRYLREHDLDSRGIAALLCGLAVKGYVKIINAEEKWTLSRRDVDASPAAARLLPLLADGQSCDIMTAADALDLSPNGAREAIAKLAKQGMPVEITGETVRMQPSGNTLTRLQPLMDREETLLYEHLVAKRTEILLSDSLYRFIKDGMAPAEEATKEAYGGNKYFLANNRIISTGWLLSLLFSLLLALLSIYLVAHGPYNAEEDGSIWLPYLVGGLFMLIGFSGITYLVIPAWAELRKPANRKLAGLTGILLTTVFFGMFFLIPFLAILATSRSWGFFYLCALITNRIFTPLMKAYTPAGRRLLDQVEGFRRYLIGVDPQQRKLMATPDMTPELFERYLPYAIVLDAEGEWAEQFAAAVQTDTHGYQPSWYEGNRWDAKKLPSAVADFAESLSSVILSASTPPKNSS